MEKKISLKGKGEWAGARKLLSALKRSRKIRGRVELRRNPQPPNIPSRSIPLHEMASFAGFPYSGETFVRGGKLYQRFYRTASGRDAKRGQFITLNSKTGRFSKNPTAAQLRRARKPGYRSTTFHPTAAQWEQMRRVLGIGPGSRPRRSKNAKVRRKKTWDYSGRRKNAAGFMSGGVFHPIRSGERAVYRTKKGKRKLLGYFPDDIKYSRRRAGEKRR